MALGRPASSIGSSGGLKDLGKPVDGVLVEDELIAEAVRACLDLASGCPSEEVVKPGGGRHLIGMRVGRREGVAFVLAGDLGFERPDRPAVFDRALASTRRRWWSGSVSSALPWPLVSAPASMQFDRLVG